MLPLLFEVISSIIVAIYYQHLQSWVVYISIEDGKPPFKLL